MSENDLMHNMGDDAPSAEEGGDESEMEGMVEAKRPWLNANTLLLLGLLTTVGAATYLMCRHAAAETARADPAVEAASGTINNFLKGGAQEQYQLAVTQRDTEKIVSQFNNYPSARQVPLAGLRSDPFESAADTQPVTMSQTDAERHAEERRKASETIVQGLKLESIVYGSHSQCMINGRPYAPGQGNGVFTIDKIEPQSVWVQVGDLRVEIQMPPPRMN